MYNLIKPKIMNIKVLGTGCRNCKTLEASAKAAVAELGLTVEVEKVEDIQKIMEYGIMRTPGLVIDEKVVVAGRVPNVNEIKELLMKNQ